jgi:Putative Ig domain
MTASLSAGTVQAGYRTTRTQFSDDLTLNPITSAPKAASSVPFSPAPLQIMTEDLPDGTIQGNYATKLVATGGVPPYHWDATAGQIAPGLTLRSSAGTISGVPFAPGAFSFKARVQDSTGASLTTTLSLSISDSPSATVSDVVADASPIDY